MRRGAQIVSNSSSHDRIASTLPGSRTKNKHAHLVPLSDLALVIIEEALADADDELEFVFPCGDGAMSPHAVARTIGRAQETSDERPTGRFGLSRWTAHDLRRTVLTNFARLGVAPVVAGAVANHRTVTKATVTLSVYTGASALFLPLCDAAQVVEPIEAFEPAECAPPLATTVLEPGETRRTVTRDLGRGTVTLTHLDNGGLERLDGIGLDLRRVAREEFTIAEDDPLAARTTMTRSFEIRRGPWRARTSERLEVSCDAEAFKIVASLEAFEGEERIFSRSWDERVPRDHI